MSNSVTRNCDRQDESSSPEFAGFEHPEANSVFCPNEFFDIAIPHLNGPALKILGFVIRKTLGWRDQNGNPIFDEVTFSQSELSKHSSVAKRHVKPSLDRLIALNFLVCSQEPSSSDRGISARNGTYQLRYAEPEKRYTRRLDEFSGFTSGIGNCTFTPNAFFDHVLPTLNHAKSKVIGIVIRNTIGYVDQNRPGGRRKVAAISRSKIKELAGISSNSTVDLAIDFCLRRNYLERTEKGSWHHEVRHRKSATYALKFVNGQNADQTAFRANNSAIGSQIGPAEPDPKSGQDGANKHAPNRAKDGSFIGPAERIPNRATIKKPENKTNKQMAAVVQLLCEFGFDESAAIQIANQNPREVIERQLDWMPLRNSDDKLAVARAAIQGNWSKPIARRESGEGIHKKWQPDLTMDDHKQAIEKNRNRAALLRIWDHASESQKHEWIDEIQKGSSDEFFNQYLDRLRGTVQEPHKRVLNYIAIARGLSPREKGKSSLARAKTEFTSESAQTT